MHFGATLRLLRLDSGLSLRDLARRLDVSSAYLSRVENGLDAAPTPARLEALARELELPPTVLMELAHRVSPLVVDYVEETPDAGALFLEIAHRRLDAEQLAQVRAFVNTRFPARRAAVEPEPARLAELLAPERVVLRLSCAALDDVLDMAAGRLTTGGPAELASLRASLRAREGEVSSAIGGGVAVPVIYAGASSRAALVTLDRPLRVETPDGKPLRLVVVLAGPRDSASRRRVLAQVARLAARGLADELARTDSPAAALRRLAALEL